MTLLWPGFLITLAAIPLMILVYVWILRKHRSNGIRYSSLSLFRKAVPRSSWWRRHLPFGIFLLAIASLAAALTRPISILTVPTTQTTIILAIDVSRSMCSADIQPSRIQAAENAARSFVKSQKAQTQIGIVAFSGFAELIQPPTMDQQALNAAIESLLTGRRTAIGSGILKSIDAISEVDKSVAPSITDTTPGVEPIPVPKGAYAPDIVVLLTDGASNTGPLPLDAAQQAADRGVRIYTIGFGTANGSEFASCQSSDPFAFGGGQPFGGGGFQFGGGGGGFRRGIDEVTLKQIANLTGGSYYPAESANQLQQVFQELPTYLIAKHKTTEVSVVFAGIGVLAVLVSILLSLIWRPLP